MNLVGYPCLPTLPSHGRTCASPQVQACTRDGGVYKVKLDEKGCLSHIFWMTVEQVSTDAFVAPAPRAINMQ